ncbi:MAG: hypothetical protein U5K30_14175 [Acidimicrobiales bacterium]|nr:hypothetical protein [Acidimicrobiales bacterium]
MTTTLRSPAAGIGRRPARRWRIVAGCAAAAVVSLAVPAALTFDAWAWLVWGREVAELGLDTTGGPSWKPLPVVFTTVVAPLGDAAVPTWLVLARTGTLLALVGTYRLASRAAGPGAGWLAGVLLVLSPDGDPRFLRLLGEGHVAPWSAACAFFAVELHLDGRRSGALALGGAAALLRPEAWPFLGLYAAWLWWRDPARRPMVVAAVAAVPVLWFVPDWLAAGSPLHGAGAAQVAADVAVVGRFADSAEVLALMVVPVAWLAAAYGLRTAWLRDERWLAVLAAGAAAWASLVMVMATVFGYAALSRFYLPATAVVCVLAGIGAARAWSALHGRGRAVLAAGLAAVAVLSLAPRVVDVVPLVESVTERGPVEAELDAALAEVGRERLLACDDLAVDAVGLFRTSVAWKLDLPLERVPVSLDADPRPVGVMLVRTGGDRDVAISRQGHTVPVLRNAAWSVLAINCPSAAP